MTERNASIKGVNGIILIIGCTAAGNRSEEKRFPKASTSAASPDSSGPNGLQRFARLGDEQADSGEHRRAQKNQEQHRPPRAVTKHPERVPGENQQHENLRYREEHSARTMIAARRSRFFIGVARNRFNSLRIRMSTVTKATPHNPPPIRLMPIKPGTRKSTYRPPGSLKI